jgi:hypothetical protein
MTASPKIHGAALTLRCPRSEFFSVPRVALYIISFSLFDPSMKRPLGEEAAEEGEQRPSPPKQHFKVGFGSPLYWDRRYRDEPVEFEWYPATTNMQRGH